MLGGNFHSDIRLLYLYIALTYQFHGGQTSSVGKGLKGPMLYIVLHVYLYRINDKCTYCCVMDIQTILHVHGVESLLLLIICCHTAVQYTANLYSLCNKAVEKSIYFYILFDDIFCLFPQGWIQGFPGG